jgi:hypothetical protein
MTMKTVSTLLKGSKIANLSADKFIRALLATIGDMTDPPFAISIQQQMITTLKQPQITLCDVFEGIIELLEAGRIEKVYSDPTDRRSRMYFMIPKIGTEPPVGYTGDNIIPFTRKG